jgi:hypothetical protein
MGDIFAPSLDCPGIFFCPDNSEFAAVTFFRATSDQDDVGQMILSFASHVIVVGSLQPESDGYPRYLQGTLQEIHYKFIVLGNPDILIGDRCEVSNHAMEAKYVEHWGNFQAEVGLTYVR